jgi:ubiquinone biosynthesis monooxygenase Coq6
VIDSGFFNLFICLLIQVWDSLGGQQIEFKSQEAGQDFIGCIVENNAILAALQSKMRSLEHVKPISASLKAMSPDSDLVSASADGGGGGKVDNPWLALELNNGETHLGRLVVGADGANSMVRQLAGLESIGWDYKQQGVVATLSITPRDANSTAWQRYLPTGPVAILPVGFIALHCIAIFTNILFSFLDSFLKPKVPWFGQLRKRWQRH